MTAPRALDRRLEAWAEEGLPRHLAALAVLVIVAVVRWHHCVLAPEPLIDEATYLEAFRAAAEGRSPYDVGSFHYTPLFAWAGAKALGALGETGTLAALRASALAGLALAVWCSSAWLATSWTRRLALAVAFVALAPAAGAGLCTGNISFAVIGVILLALTQWPRRSWLSGAVPSGLALGATVAAKPLAPLALVALVVHRAAPGRDGPERPQALPPPPQELAARVAGSAGGLVAALLLLPMVSELAAMSAQPIHPLSYARSFSLQRVLSLAGVEVNPLVVFVAVATGLAVLARLLPLDRSQLLAVAVAASILGTPIVWNHTLLLTLPLQVMALAVAIERRRDAPRTESRRRFYQIVLVALLALSIQLSEGYGAVDALSRGAQLVFLSLPCFAPVALAAYVLVSTGASRSLSGRRNR